MKLVDFFNTLTYYGIGEIVETKFSTCLITDTKTIELTLTTEELKDLDKQTLEAILENHL